MAELSNMHCLAQMLEVNCASPVLGKDRQDTKAGYVPLKPGIYAQANVLVDQSGIASAFLVGR
jgi:hypothetical protein